ncbi:FliI/YscN family ATPase [Benzoatithermus flavus]|uniref:FliI/YscN family ATPase n=1 Tax=Benzoatithermus flavus TaxID=3108223 RepID=A0ABU8XTD9_9PROT
MWSEPEFEVLTAAFAAIPSFRHGGYVTGCSSGLITASGLDRHAAIGDLCLIERREAATPSAASPLFRGQNAVMAEVVGFTEAGVKLVAYEEPVGITRGAKVALEPGLGILYPCLAWRGRVLDALARPIDGGPPLPRGDRAYRITARAVAAERRRGLGRRLSLGVRALDLFTPCCDGQRLGIFAGSGVGKSTLLSMIARDSDADALVVGLIGERGRELNDFLEHTLGAEGRARSVVVVATSDLPAMLRRRAAYVALTVAEQLRDQGLRVLCLMDSVTRFAMALREIYLAAGEVPASRGYPPSVLAELPRLLERAGPGEGEGSITGLFTVLVEGDDTNEPVSDTVRGILDGHIVLDRAIAEGGRFPAVDPLRSVSRSAPGCYTAEEWGLVREARRLMRLHADMEELIRLGAYRSGSNAELDRAIAVRPALEAVLRQDASERAVAGSAAFASLAEALARPTEERAAPSRSDAGATNDDGER